MSTSRGQRTVRWLTFFLLGFAPFSVINTLWSEVALFVHHVPEEVRIGSAISAASNVGNLTPLLYMVLAATIKPRERVMFGVLMTFALAGCVLLFFWRSVLLVGGAPVSYMIYASSFCAGVSGTLVLVLFSFLSPFASGDTTAFSTGLGFAGIWAAALAQLQSATGSPCQPLFSIELFAALTIAVLLVSVASFVYIERRRFDWTLKRDEMLLASELGRSFDADSPVSPARNLSVPQFIKFAGHLIAHMFFASIAFFFVMPGLVPFLSPDDRVLTAITTAYMVGNMLGRSFPSFFQFWHLWPLNLVQAICLGLLYWAGASRVSLFGSDWVLLPIAMILATANGHVATLCFLIADKKCVNSNVSPTTSARARRWIALSNQLGVVVGGYICVLFVHLNAFRKEIATDMMINEKC